MDSRAFPGVPIGPRSIAGLLAILLSLAACGGTPAPSAVPSPNSTNTPLPTPIPTVPPRRIVGYFTSWGIYERDYQAGDVPGDKLTHVNYAFANIDKDTLECIRGDIWSDDATLRQFPNVKEQFPHLKMLISIGGWTWSGRFSDAALTEESRQRFVKSCVNLFLIRYKEVFDGVDIDWEFPVSGGMPGNVERPEDRRNFTLLLQEFRRQLDELGAQNGKHYFLTIAAPASPQLYANFEWGELIQYLDWVNLMAYDFHGGWDKVTNFNAPLYASAKDPSPPGLNVQAAVQAYLDAGIPPEKLVLGVPFYGRGWAGVVDVDHGLYQKSSYLPRGTWEAGVFDYKDLAANYVDQKGYTRYWHDQAQVPWLFNPEKGVFIAYEDPESVALKADYVLSHHLGGMMFWELTADGGVLLDTIYWRLKSP